MESVERLVGSYIVSENSREIDELSGEINAGRATLLQLVKALGTYLTSDSDGIRVKGIRFLSAVLDSCVEDKLNQHTVRVLLAFFCDKLGDDPCIIPALEGIQTLCKTSSFADSEAIIVVNSMASNIDMRSHVQSTRFLVFKILDLIVSGHRAALLSSGEQFLSDWLKLASGEKDPRNLLIAFAVYRVILIEFPIQNHILDLFENTFCYFPITFRPPPNDPYGITTDDLIQALRSVLSASPVFGPKALPLFLEKLSLGSPAIRRDILQTLATCLPVYGSGIASKYAVDIWKNLKIEIFQPTDSSTENDALKAVQALIMTIYENQTPSESESTEGLAKEICNECALILHEPEKSQAKPAIKIVAALLQTAAVVTNFILGQIIPPFLTLFNAPEGVTARYAILTCFGIIFEAMVNSKESTGVETSNTLDPYKDSLLGCLIVGLKDPTPRSAALRALSRAIKVEKFFTVEELGYIIHKINEVTFEDIVTNNDSWNEAIHLLQELSLISPDAIERTSLTTLFGYLPDKAPEARDSTQREIIWKVLKALETLCTPAPLFQTLVIRLLAKVDIICGFRTAGSVHIESGLTDREERSSYVHSILVSLSRVFGKKRDLKDPDVSRYVEELVDRLYKLHILSAIHESAETCVATHRKVIEVSARIGTFITQSLSESQQTSLLSKLFRIFLHGDLDALSISSNLTFRPFESESMPQKQSVVLLMGPLVAIHPTTSLPMEHLSDFILKNLMWTFKHPTEDFQISYTHKAMGSLLNKEADKLSQFISAESEEYWNQCIASSMLELSNRKIGLDGWLWLAKGLGARMHPAFLRFADKLMSLFDDEVIGWEAGRIIGLIGSKDDILTKQNNAVVKLLHSQRYLQHVLPKIIDMASQSPSARQVAALVALSSLIKSVSKHVYEPHLVQLIPLLLRGIELPDDVLKADVMETLYEVLQESQEAALLSNYSSTLVNLTLKIITLPSQNRSNVRARIAALRLLGALPKKVRYDIIHPHRNHVIRQLGNVLDDPKRTIRTEAVESRSAWFTSSSHS